MEAIYDVNSGCFRYVVPFYFDDDFNTAFEKVNGIRERDNSKKKWKRRFADNGGAESDLYEYIKNEYRDASGKDEESLPGKEKIGVEFGYHFDDTDKKKRKPLLELLYLKEQLFSGVEDINIVNDSDTDKNYLKFHIRDMGLILYRNRLGLFWYEVSLPLDKMTADDLVMFQNRVKEFNQGSRKLFFWKLGKEVPKCGISLADGDSYISPFLFGKWVVEQLSCLNIHFFANRKSSYSSMLIHAKNQIKHTVTDKKNMLIIDDGQTGEVDEKILLPDKSLLFSYVSFECKNGKDNRDDREKVAYYLTNGYKSSYHLGEETRQEMKKPFDNAIWYATQEGAAYLAWVEQDNRSFFTNTILSKIRGDYFTLYLKVLYQSYSLLMFAQRINQELSAENDEMHLLEANDQDNNGLLGDINLFLAKSMATSVSHIHHQSMFYIFLKQQLHIHEDVESVTAGLGAIETMRKELIRAKKEEIQNQEWKEEKERDDKIQRIMGLFALLGIFSALVDGFDFIAKFNAGGEWSALTVGVRGVEIVCWVVIAIIGIPTIVIAWKSMWMWIKEKKKK